MGGRHRRPGRPNWRRIGVLCAAFVAWSSVPATATAAILLWYGERQIDQVDVDTDKPGDIDGDGTVDVVELSELRNVLVVGSDSRAGLSREDRQDLGTGAFEGVRTDTIMLIQLDPERQGAAMLSFPRDLLVERCDGTQGRINGAFEIGRASGVGGPNCLVRTVRKLTGIPIHHYAQIDFQGFVKVVDALGGVKLYLDRPIVDSDAHIDLPKGCVTLSGREALGFVRVRKIDSDFGRIARQQRFLREIVDQVTSARVALNVPKLFSLVDAGAKALDTDKSLSLGLMRRIAFSFRDLSSDRIDTRTVPAFNRVIDGVAYVVPDTDQAQALFDSFRAGQAAPAEIGTEGPADVAIADVPPITVLNATRAEGLAATAAAALRARGFKVEATDNAPVLDAPYTRILHPPGRREEAQLIAEVFPGARLVRDDMSLTFTVEVGPDQDVDRLIATASERPSPTGPPSPQPAPTFAGAGDSERRNC